VHVSALNDKSWRVCENRQGQFGQLLCDRVYAWESAACSDPLVWR
jgi:hypothetical protein